MAKGTSLNMHTSKNKINCKNIKQLLIRSLASMLSENDPSTSEVHGGASIVTEGMVLDVRTYICTHSLCQLQHKRSHRRISEFNWKKMQKNQIDLTKIKNLAIMLAENKKLQEENEQTKVFGCVYCLNPKLKGLRHTHFVRSKQDVKKNNHTKTPYIQIEEVFTKIDRKAAKNAEKILAKKCPEPPGNKLLQNNELRMSYGDINYLGNNKALLYFDRGIRGTQTFTNSMLPISKHQQSKDLIVLDGIVFSADCKCDSSHQHREMFPHYRVTCAVGLTCPAKMNNYEKEAFKRKKNASTETFTKASSMLIRYWR